MRDDERIENAIEGEELTQRAHNSSICGKALIATFGLSQPIGALTAFHLSTAAELWLRWTFLLLMGYQR